MSSFFIKLLILPLWRQSQILIGLINGDDFKTDCTAVSRRERRRKNRHMRIYARSARKLRAAVPPWVKLTIFNISIFDTIARCQFFTRRHRGHKEKLFTYEGVPSPWLRGSVWPSFWPSCETRFFAIRSFLV